MDFSKLIEFLKAVIEFVKKLLSAIGIEFPTKA